MRAPLFLKNSMAGVARRTIKGGAILLSAIGGAYTVCQLINDAGSWSLPMELFSKCFWYILVLSFIAYLCWIFLPRRRFTTRIENTDVKISIEAGDLIGKDSSMVIPTNTLFATSTTSGDIRSTSIQSQYVRRFHEKDSDSFCQAILQGLTQFQPISAETLNGRKFNRYPIGTVSKVEEHNGKEPFNVYFLAVCDVNSEGTPIYQGVESLKNAIKCLWDQLSLRGHHEEVYVPLFGTGRAGMAQATRKIVMDAIIDTLLEHMRHGQEPTSHLHIVVYNRDESDINWDEQSELLRHKSAAFQFEDE